MTAESKNSGFNEYVVGFLFDSTRTRVVLVKKNRPAWQAGMLNGVGGRIEAGEEPLGAMVREFFEEAGALVPADAWQNVAVLDYPVGRVHFFAAFNDEAFYATHTAGDEEIRVIDVDILSICRVIRNLNYLIPLCLHHEAAASGSRLYLPVYLNEIDATASPETGG